MDLHEEIAKVAYGLFERDGRQHGKDREHWTEAERMVKAGHAAKEQEVDSVKSEKLSVPAKGASGKAQETGQKQASIGTSPAAGNRVRKTTAKERAK